MKKAVIIIIILGVMAIGIGVYFAWKNQLPNTETPITGTNEQGVVNTNHLTVSQKMKLISSAEILGYTIKSSTSSADVFYVAENGNIFKTSGEKEEILSDFLIKEGQSTIFSPDGATIAIKSKNNSGIKFSIFDALKKVWQSASMDAASLSWSPQGDRVALLKDGNGKSDLFIGLSNSLKAPEKVISLNIKDFDIQWVSGDKINIASRPADDVWGEVWQLDLKTKRLVQIISGKGLMVSWSKFGDVGLKFSANGSGYALNLVGPNGENKADFRFKTFPDKCFISSPTLIYCAIPKDQEMFAKPNLLDEYLKRGVYFRDGIYQIDLAQNKFAPLYEDENPIIDAVDLTVSGNTLYFINRYDRKLYQMEL